jgi:transcription termination/antitermination protein NusA
MNNEIRLVVDAVSNEKNISQDIIFEALEAALETATKRKNSVTWDVKVFIDRKTGDYKTVRRWTIVDTTDFEDYTPDAYLTLDEAKAKNLDLNVGEFIDEPIPSVDFGRIAAQTAKQVVLQRLRSAKREQIADEYRAQIGELVTGTVKKASRDLVVVELGNHAEALLKRNDMLPHEVVRIGDRVRAYLVDVRSDARGPQLIISRSCPEMLVKLFEIEVPEIGDGLIEVMGAARDPGSRAKIAVLAKDNRIDPVGACVGMRGSRVQAVSSELGGERVDIILWDDNPAQFVINAIAPAEVKTIVLDDDSNSIDVIVDESQLSAAIGRNGQNVRLASKLTGWELNVLSEKQAEDRDQMESERLFTLFQSNLETSEDVAIALVEAGFSGLEEIAYMPKKELLEVPGIDEETCNQIREKAKDILLTAAIAEEERLDTNEPAQDLLDLEGVDRMLAYTLASKGIVTKEDLAEQSVNDLLEIEGMDEERAGKLIMLARAHWFSES